MDRVWQLVRQPELLWRAWEGEIVVYNDASGDTHHLDPLAAEAFEAFLEAPIDTAGLTSRIAESLGVEKTTELGDALTKIVERFHSFGLIEPVSR